jgi:amidophosphoribosyltransferase
LNGFRDESGLFAVYGVHQAAHHTYLGLHALQHRGGGGAGIVASDGEMLRVHRQAGLVQEAFEGPQLQRLSGHIAVGQVSDGDPDPCSSDVEVPLFARYRDGQLTLAMNGRLANGAKLRQMLKSEGAVFQSRTDAEVILHLLANARQRTFVNRLVETLWQVDGAYALVACTEDCLVAVRDPRGFRPLLVGSLGDAVIVASEASAIRHVGGEVVREIEPGEMLVVDSSGSQSVSPFTARSRAACVQELISIAKNDASFAGLSAYDVRRELGCSLAREARCPNGEVVLAVPGAADVAALGYSTVSRTPYHCAVLKAPYTGRRYVEPSAGIPAFGTRLQLSVVPAVVDSRRVVLVSMTLLNGRLLKRLIRLIRESGAQEVHVRVASAPVRTACRCGIIGPAREELVSYLYPSEVDLAQWLGAASIAFLSLEGVREVLGTKGSDAGFCMACFTGEIPFPMEEADDQLSLFEGEEDAE